MKADKWFRDVRVAIHQAVGTGALVTPTGLTPIGRILADRVAQLEDDAVSPLGYGAQDLQNRLTTWSAAEADVAALEAHLGRALVRMVLDYRVLKLTGPFRLVGEDDVGRDRAIQKQVRDLALEALRGIDAAGVSAVLDPPHPSWEPLKRAYKRYREIAAAGDCKSLPTGARLRVGMKGASVEKLQERLACEGYLAGEIDGQFDDDVMAAVKQFQRHHELPDVEGNVLGETIDSLNVPITRRRDQLQLALQRLRETRVREMGDYYMKVNIPAYELNAVEGGKIILRNKVIVGTNRLDDDKVQLIQGHINRTKILTSRMYDVLVNPTWILPERVAKGEIVGKLEEDADYLSKKNIGSRTLPDGRQVYIQGQGKGNVLGKVKFLLEKTNAIYLHDTDKPWLFREERRAFSHGCMRVHEAVKFAKWVLLKDGYPEAEVDKTLALVKMQKSMPLRKPVNFLTEYITVDFSDEGLPKFLTDTYGYDEAFERGRLPPYTQTRWGSKILRPRWVPLVEETHVKEWREKGQQAPRDPKWTPGGGGKGAQPDGDSPAGDAPADDQPAGFKAPFPEDKPGKKAGKTDSQAKPGAKKPAAKKPARGGR